jgi:hypothetical protein
MWKALSPFLLIISFWGIGPMDVGAQTTQIQGRVFDAETGLPLPFVNIAFSGSGEGTTTNESGKYAISTDSRPGKLYASFLGYASQSIEVIRGIAQSKDIALETRNIELIAAEVQSDRNTVNPAKPFMERVLKAKDRNNPSRIPASVQRAYTRLELDINEITLAQTERFYWGPFSWIFDYMDSSEVRPALPLIFGESLSEVRTSKSPKRKQIHVDAARMSGRVTGGGSSNPVELNERFPEINLYENQLLILNRAFTSPLHNRGAAHYRYYILDTLDLGGRINMHLAFIPRRKGELTFEGELWIDTLSLALSRVDARLSPSANVNYVRGLSWHQEYIPVARSKDSSIAWMLEHESMLMDISLSNRSIGAYLRRTINLSEHGWAESWPDSVWRGGRDLKYAAKSTSTTEEEWSLMRHEPLLSRESRIYEMVDSIQGMPQYEFIRKLGYFVATGFIQTGPIEIGAWWSAYTQNVIEGNRYRLDIRTSNEFSTRISPGVFAAYGTDDRRWKSGFNSRFIIRKSPRTEVLVEIKRDLELFGMAGLLDPGEIFTSALSTNSLNQLSEVVRGEVSVIHEFGKGLTGFLEWRHRRVSPLGTMQFINAEGPIEQFITTELTGQLRFAFQERFVSGEFDRISLGTEWPILTTTITQALPNILDSKHQYTRCTLEGEDVVRLGFSGRLEWLAEAGLYLGKAPFPLLEVVPTSGTVFNTPESFNLLGFYEKITDRWVKASVEWHAEGLVLNHIPWIRQLGWREVVTAKAIHGDWDTKHEDLAVLPENTTGLQGTYTECGIGLENLFHFLRIEGIWRTDRPIEQKESWGIRVGFSAEI